MLLIFKRLAAIALFAASTSPASAQDASWDAVVTAAKQEGKLVVYNMALGAPYFQAVIKSFEKTYGIPVESLDLRASELVERIRTEQSAGRYLGDTEMVTTTMIEEQLKNGDFIQKLPPIPNAANLRPPFKTTDFQRAGLCPADGHPDQHKDGQGRRRSDQLERPQRAEMEGQAAVG